jgi:hypothetical protein
VEENALSIFCPGKNVGRKGGEKAEENFTKN